MAKEHHDFAGEQRAREIDDEIAVRIQVADEHQVVARHAADEHASAIDNDVDGETSGEEQAAVFGGSRHGIQRETVGAAS